MPIGTHPLARLSGAWARWISRADTTKGGAMPLAAFESVGQPQWAPRDYAAFAREGMMQNAIVYRCVRMIAEAAASVPLLLYQGDGEIEAHPLLDLMKRPARGITGTDLLENFFGFLLVSGNAYVQAVALGGELRELHVLRPDRMRVVPGADGWPEAWDYQAGGAIVRIAGEALPGLASVLHLKLFHPAHDYYGLSPIEAAATAVDIHNAAARWTKALLDNSARPSGALVYTTGGQLTADQFARLKSELETSFQGARNAGRPLLLEGGLDWKAMSLSPRDMDFMEAKHAAAREIALAIGVPPMLLGIPGDNTYSNYQEAQRSFWRQTVLPLVNRAARALGGWLAPAWGAELRLVPDLDAIEALSAERDALWTRLEGASFLTRDEKRAAAGYGERGEMQALVTRFNPYHDDLGRFTSSPDGPQQSGAHDSQPPGEPPAASTTDASIGEFDDPILVQQGRVAPSITIPGDQAGSLDGSEIILNLATPFQAGGQPAGIYTNGPITRSGNTIDIPGPAAIVAPGLMSWNNGRGGFSITGFSITRNDDGSTAIEPKPGF